MSLYKTKNECIFFFFFRLNLKLCLGNVNLSLTVCLSSQHFNHSNMRQTLIETLSINSWSGFFLINI